MRFIIGIILIYTAVNIFFLGSGIVIALLLHLIIPEVDIGMCIIIGVMTSGISMYYFLRMGRAEPFDDDDDDDDSIDETHREHTIPSIVLPDVTYTYSRSKKNKKRK